MNRFPALGLDFVASRRQGDRIGWLLLGTGVITIGIGAIAWLMASGDGAHWAQEAERWNQTARRESSGQVKHRTAPTPPRPQMLAAAKAIDRLATPWGGLYSALEDSLDDTVSLLSIVPSADKGEVRLNGEAKDFPALRAYIRRLSNSEVLSDVRLLRQEVRQNDSQQPIVFSLVATWRQRS